MKRTLTFLLLLLITANNIFAQSGDVEMADVMRSNGKIYVVVGVIAIVFAGIVLYLVAIDRKVSRLEKKVKNEEV